MAFFDTNSTSSGKDFKQPTVGIQEARVLQVIDLGVRPAHPKYPDSKPKQALMFVFELSDDKDVSSDGTERALRSFLFVNVCGKKFDGSNSKFLDLVEALGVSGKFELVDLLGKPVSLTLAKDKNDKIKPMQVTGVSKKLIDQMPALIDEPLALDFSNPDAEVLSKLGKGTIRMLTEALNYSGSKVEVMLKKLNTEAKQTTEVNLDNDII